MKRLTFIVFALAALYGCATDKPQSAIMNQPGDYKLGYSDGCASGHFEGGHPYDQFVKDNYRYIKDALYSQGWKDGFVTCKNEYIAKERDNR